MRRMALVGVVTLGVGGCGHSKKLTEREQVRAVAEKYVAADADGGDGATFCSLLTPAARREFTGTYRYELGLPRSATCAQVAEKASKGFPRFDVVKITMRGDHANAEINDAAISDSGNDSIGLVKRGGRWLIDSP